MKYLLLVIFVLSFAQACSSASFTGSQGRGSSNNGPEVICGDEADCDPNGKDPYQDPCEVDPDSEGCEQPCDEDKDECAPEPEPDCPNQNDAGQSDDWHDDHWQGEDHWQNEPDQECEYTDDEDYDDKDEDKDYNY